VAFFFRGAAPGISASVQALVTCLALFALSRFTAAVACARADPAILLALLRNMLINGFFMLTIQLKRYFNLDVVQHMQTSWIGAGSRRPRLTVLMG